MHSPLNSALYLRAFFDLTRPSLLPISNFIGTSGGEPYTAGKIGILKLQIWNDYGIDWKKLDRSELQKLYKLLKVTDLEFEE